MSETTADQRSSTRMGGVRIGTRLTFVLMPLVLIPILIMGGLAYMRSRDILRDQASAQMNSAAQSQVAVLQDWTQVRQQRLQLGAQRSEVRSSIADLLSQSPPPASSLDALHAELDDLRSYQGQSMFSQLLVARLSDALVIAASNPAWEGQPLPALLSGSLPTASTSTRAIYDDPLLSPGSIVMLSAVPLRALDPQSPDALLIGANLDLRIAALMEEMQVYWEERGPYLVQRGSTLLALAPDVIIQLPTYATSPSAQPIPDHPIFSHLSTSSGIIEYDSLDGTPVLGAFQWLPDLNLAVLVELPQSDVFSGLSSLVPYTLGLVILAAALTWIVMLITTSRMLRPLGTLTEFAQRISRGEWRFRVPEERSDEIGLLASAFNRMAEDLSQLYRSLEARVEERTRQIRTAAQVAGDAASVPGVDSLLETAVGLINHRFGYYHAAIYLLDREDRFAHLRAASSPGGARLLQNRHKLPVGKASIIGYTTSTGRARVAGDVTQDALFQPNPELPDTRSEVAVPLRVGERVIGALDVQSTEADGFGEEDVIVLQTMADQLAVSIENARLLARQTHVAAQRQRVIDIFQSLAQKREYGALLEAAPEEIQRAYGFERVSVALVEGEEVVLGSSASRDPEHSALIGARVAVGRGLLGRTVSQGATIRMPTASRSDEWEHTDPALGEVYAGASAPMISRGKVIGVLVAETGKEGGLDPEDVEALELLAGQLAVSLENMRLVSETQRSLRQLDALYREQTREAWEALLAGPAGESVRKLAEYGEPLSEAELEEALNAVLHTDIVSRGNVIGDITLEPKRTSAQSEDDLEILRAVAEEVGDQLEQIRLMEDIRRRAAHLQTASEITAHATQLLDLDTLLGRAANLICDRFGYYLVSFFLLDEAGKTTFMRKSSGEIGERLTRQGVELNVGSASIIGQATGSGEYYLAQDVDADPNFQPHPLLPETASELAVPLKIGNRVIGALDIQHTRRDAFDQEEVDVLHILADQIAISVQNALLFDEALERAEREQAVAEIGGSIWGSGDTRQILETSAQELRSHLGASEVRIRLRPGFRQEEDGKGG
jgi:GAF domain-containing protein/HAMP domain-containing protein